MSVPNWTLDRADALWVGPVTTSVKNYAGVVDSTAVVQLAVVTGEKSDRPKDTDWAVPVPNPDDSSQSGVTVSPVAGYCKQFIWARATRGSTVIVLAPVFVGSITRT